MSGAADFASARTRLTLIGPEKNGAQIGTMRFKVLDMRVNHRLTDIGLAHFLKDSGKVAQKTALLSR